MKIRDIHPGYLTRESLLSEYRDLHQVASRAARGKKIYPQSCEAVRWFEYGWALNMRHKQVVCEMVLRGCSAKPSLTACAQACAQEGKWPEVYIDEPTQQFSLLQAEYADKEVGRIPLPKNAQQLWSQHKYSVLARDPELYQKIGRDLAQEGAEFAALALLLTETLREEPTEGRLRNALQHMWGYVSDRSVESQAEINDWPLRKLLSETQKRAMAKNVAYLVSSTALSELMVWLPEP